MTSKFNEERLNRRIDLHIHTTASDGRWSPEQLIEALNENNIKMFSVTDHDTVENTVKMPKLIEGTDLEFVYGVEVACTYNGKEYHITSYGIDPEDSKLIELINENVRVRDQYDENVISHIASGRTDFTMDEYYNFEYDHHRGGWKGLNFLIDKGIVENIGGFFGLIGTLDIRCIFNEPKGVIEIIRAAGGTPFLAHPSAYKRGERMTYDELEQWVKFGVAGLECFTPYNQDGDSEYYKQFCEERGLLVSGGSDCHGGFVGRALGRPEVRFGDLKLDFFNE